MVYGTSLNQPCYMGRPGNGEVGLCVPREIGRTEDRTRSQDGPLLIDSALFSFLQSLIGRA